MLQTAQIKLATTAKKKKNGHILKECPIRPPKRNFTAFTALVGSSIPNNSSQSSTGSTKCSTTTSTMTPEMVQQMIISAFSTPGFSSKSSSSWYFDSGASNHMNNNAQFLTNIKKYFGNLKRRTVDGNQLPITVDYSRFTWVYFLRSKGEVFSAFRLFFMLMFRPNFHQK